MRVLSHSAKNQLAFRGIAACWVVLAHLIFREEYNAGFAHYSDWGLFAQLIRFDFLAVDFFFILSGCLLTQAYWEYFTQKTTGGSIDRFYAQRLARILPLHYVAGGIIGMYMLIGWPHPTYSGNAELLEQYWQFTGILNLAAMHSWGIFPAASWNEPAWTVSAMFFVYVLFPNLVLLIRKLRENPKILMTLIYALLIGYALLRMTVQLGSNSDGAGSLVRALVFFFCGCLVARVHMPGLWTQWHWDKVLGITFAVFLALVALWWQWQFDMFFFHVLYPFFMLGFLRANGRVHRIVANRIACWLGGIAYAIYLMHYPVLLALKHVAGDMLGAWAASGSMGTLAAYAVTIACLLAVAWGMTHAVELPCYRAAKRWLKLRPKAEQKDAHEQG
jgi:peptidoglycan/LPS O-acetylase OafA/YrhL